MSNTPEDTYQPSSEAFNDDYIAFIAEKDIIEKFNRFIWLYANEYYRHLIDSDQNGGEHMRRAITLHTQEAEIALARKVLGVSSMVHKQKGVTQSMRLKHLTKEMLKIIPDTFGVIEDQLTNPTEGSN